MKVSAPATVKLFGEHAVVYGRLSLAVAVDLYAQAEVTEIESGIELVLPDLAKKQSFTGKQLLGLYESFMSRKSIADYLASNSAIDQLPFATLLAVIYAEYGIEGKRIKLSSQIPMQKGFGSSAAIATAMATALLAGGEKDRGIIEAARTSEIVMHKSEGAGRIDIPTSYFGGFVSFSQKEGARRLDISTNLDLLAIDTGPKKSTAETVGHVAELYQQDKKGVEQIFDKIEGCTKRGIKSLEEGNVAEAGRLMYENQEYLAKLGVSSERLDKAIAIAKKNHSPGAKLSGGGGGGMAIALNSANLKAALESAGFKCQELKVSFKGAKDLLSS
ncbi:MAG: mevalonate kinase [Candidatus Micrarchaeia archaeon]